MDHTDILAAPVTLPCGLQLPNRLVKGPMAEGLAKKSTHNRPNDLHNALYRSWGEGGFGMIITGNVQVDPRFLGSSQDVTFHSKDLTNPIALSEWKIWATASQASGTPTVVQLCHTGRQSPVGAGTRSFLTKALAPSAVALNFPGGLFTKVLQALIFGTPREMTLADIDEVVEMFVNTSKMVFEAGFKGVELHAAHGYLFTQFLSPKMNLRTDDYGGTTEKRLKFLLRVISEVRAATSKSFCIGVKLNSADFQSMGLSEDEVLSQVATLSAANVDFIDISGGTYETLQMAESRKKPLRDSTRLREAYFSDFAAKARLAAPSTIVMVTGGFRTREGMAAAVQTRACDLIGLARPTALEPELPREKILNRDVGNEKAAVAETTIRGIGWFRTLPIIGVGFEIAWYAMQIARIAKGKKPDPTLSLTI